MTLMAKYQRPASPHTPGLFQSNILEQRTTQKQSSRQNIMEIQES